MWSLSQQAQILKMLADAQTSLKIAIEANNLAMKAMVEAHIDELTKEFHVVKSDNNR